LQQNSPKDFVYIHFRRMITQLPRLTERPSQQIVHHAMHGFRLISERLDVGF
jgi:hypothetical protein